MKKRLIAVAIACATLALPAAARADDATNTTATMKHDPAMMATMLCRKALPGEKPTGVLTGDTKVAIVCKTVQPDVMMHGPTASHALSVQQAEAEWQAYIQSALMVPGGTGGG